MSFPRWNQVFVRPMVNQSQKTKPYTPDPLNVGLEAGEERAAPSEPNPILAFRETIMKRKVVV